MHVFLTLSPSLQFLTIVTSDVASIIAHYSGTLPPMEGLWLACIPTPSTVSCSSPITSHLNVSLAYSTYFQRFPPKNSLSSSMHGRWFGDLDQRTQISLQKQLCNPSPVMPQPTDSPRGWFPVPMYRPHLRRTTIADNAYNCPTDTHVPRAIHL